MIANGSIVWVDYLRIKKKNNIMNYTEKQVEEILIRVWNDRVKGGGWDNRENFIKEMKKVNNLPIQDVRESKITVLVGYMDSPSHRPDIKSEEFKVVEVSKLTDLNILFEKITSVEVLK